MLEQHRLLKHISEHVDADQIQRTLTTRLSPINAVNLRKAHALVERGDMIEKVIVEEFPQ